MRKKTRFILFGTILLLALLGSFLGGALAYRSGLLSAIKIKLTGSSPPQSTHAVPTTEPDFEFEILQDPIQAALNSQPLPEDRTPLRFIVAGHIYGKPGEKYFHPAPTFITNISLLNQLAPDFIVLLGDTVWKPSNESFEVLDEIVLEQFHRPVFNAVGNHDMTRRALYEQRYGNTVYAFQYKGQLFIFLDTTLKYYDLTPQEYDFIRAALRDASHPTAIHIFMHHVLFLEEEEIVDKQALKPNEGDGRSAEFMDFVRSELVPFSLTAPIYIYAGDVGAFESSNLSPLYKELPDGNITFLATGLGGNPTDSVLIVQDDPDVGIEIQPFSLTGQEMGPIEDYSLAEWFKR